MKRYLLIVMCCLFGLYQPLHSQNNEVNGHEWVDLALPSGLKWATCNVGAKTPEASGNYYAWGETQPKDEYNSSLTYGNDISGNVQYDVAAANWGEGWRMPTKEEMQELIDCCTWEWTKQNKIKGYNVTGPNGNSIFLPTTGDKSGSTFNSGTCGSSYYWSSTPYSSSRAYYLYFNSSSHGVSFYDDRYYGRTVRPVRDRETIIEIPFIASVIEHYTDITAIIKTYASSPGTEITERGFYWGTNAEPSEADNKVVLENEVGYKASALMKLTPNTTYYVKAYATNESGTSYSEVVSFTTLETPVEYEYVDLGLPSGLKWATHNIGATTPEEYGNYYVWGEVLTKETYTETNSETYNKPMSDISGTEYDAATANWGGDWRMPTYNEMYELIDNCTWTWTIQNGVNGYKVASKVNSNYIFLPAAGYRNGASLNYAGTYGKYWSSKPVSNNSAYALDFTSSKRNMFNYSRIDGYSIRPVREAVEKPTVTASVENYTDQTSIIKTYVSSSAEITERGFYWGTNAEPSESDNKVVLENEVGYKVSGLINLTPNTTYYVKAYAVNESGTSYSEVVSFTTLETPVEYEYVDLGLPSGLKWATHNIGATTAEEYGNYYAWGEVVTKETYTEANSETYGKSMSDISGTEYDAATFNWGGNWRMPTEEEMKEMLSMCVWEGTMQNQVYGYKLTSKINGNSIFLPAAGYRNGASLSNAGSSGSYWSSTPDGNNGANHFVFGIISGMGSNNRYCGCSIRPVRE